MFPFTHEEKKWEPTKNLLVISKNDRKLSQIKYPQKHRKQALVMVNVGSFMKTVKM